MKNNLWFDPAPQPAGSVDADVKVGKAGLVDWMAGVVQRNTTLDLRQSGTNIGYDGARAQPQASAAQPACQRRGVQICDDQAWFARTKPSAVSSCNALSTSCAAASPSANWAIKAAVAAWGGA